MKQKQQSLIIFQFITDFLLTHNNNNNNNNNKVTDFVPCEVLVVNNI